MEFNGSENDSCPVSSDPATRLDRGWTCARIARFLERTHLIVDNYWSARVGESVLNTVNVEKATNCM